MKQNNSENTPENTDLVRKYFNNSVSKWLINQVKTGEGFRETAYAATPTEARKGIWTIGYGTVDLYKEDGYPFSPNRVRQGDTLSSLKYKMGYGSLTNEKFAEKIMINHLLSVHNSNRAMFKYLDSHNLPYIERLRDGFMEFSYLAGGMFRKGKDLKAFEQLINAIKTRDLNNIAGAFAYFRYSYHRNHSPDWNSNKWTWMRRNLRACLWIKEGKAYSDAEATRLVGGTKNALGYEKAFRLYLGVIVDM